MVLGQLHLGHLHPDNSTPDISTLDISTPGQLNPGHLHPGQLHFGHLHPDNSTPDISTLDISTPGQLNPWSTQPRTAQPRKIQKNGLLHPDISTTVNSTPKFSTRTNQLMANSTWGSSTPRNLKTKVFNLGDSSAHPHTFQKLMN